MKLVEITWHDSTIMSDGGWLDVDEIDEAMTSEGMRHVSVGFLVSESDEAVAIAQSRNAGDTPENHDTRIAGALIIPRAAIVNLVELRRK